MADIMQTTLSIGESFSNLIEIPQEIVAWSQVDNKSSLRPVMACCRTNIKPIPEPMLTKI